MDSTEFVRRVLGRVERNRLLMIWRFNSVATESAMGLPTLTLDPICVTNAMLPHSKPGSEKGSSPRASVNK